MMYEDQSQALQQYTESTTGILGYLKNQLTSIGLWTNTPGASQKVVSSAGYSWAIGADNSVLYYCNEPCTGKWEISPQRFAEIGRTLIDIAADNQNLYVLYSEILNVPAPQTSTPTPPPVVPPPPPPPAPAAPTSKPVSGWMDFFPSSITDTQLKAQAPTNPAVFRLVMLFNYTTWAEVMYSVTTNFAFVQTLGGPLPAAPASIQNDVDGKALFATMDFFALKNLPVPNVNAAQRALIASNNNAPAAVQWLGVHANDAGVTDAFPVPTPPSPPPPPPVAPPPPETPTPMIQQTSYKVISMSGDGSKPSNAINTVVIPFKASSISVTNGYLWASGDSKMAYCAKPCSGGGWTVKDDPHKLMGAGATSVYAIDPNNASLVKTDETAQTGWAPVAGFAGVSPVTVGAEADSVGLYAADSKNMYRCDGTCSSEDQLQTVDTQGFIPIGAKGSISVNPTTKNVWMASSSSGTGGNLFQRLDAQNNLDPVLDYIDENQNNRDRIFNSLGGSSEIQTYKISSDIAKRESNEAVKKAVDMGGKLDDVDNKLGLLQRKVATAKNFGGNLTASVVPLQILLFALVLITMLYILTGAILSQTILMWTSVIILSVAFGLAIYFSTTT
uniref:Uncharacterized protein n=1 Tax=viral metagenome TaxID=1070528 RepID=A0A6C0I7C2_9ZZZZ